MMMHQATRAYEAAATHRSQREQEADVFRRAIGALKAARNGNALQRVRALADNRRLWMTVHDLMRDPDNNLPPELRAAIVSVGLTVQREMDLDSPNFDFLIEINENFAAGLSAGLDAAAPGGHDTGGRVTRRPAASRGVRSPDIEPRRGSPCKNCTLPPTLKH